MYQGGVWFNRKIKLHKFAPDFIMFGCKIDSI